jgi:glycosyltransferase involved in cell wall biosynthesis
MTVRDRPQRTPEDRGDDDELGVLLGPTDPAGVASNLAAGLEASGHAVRTVVWEPSPYGYRHDAVVERLSQRLRFAAGVGRHEDVVHTFGGRSWVPYADLALARLRGATCVVQYNGTDARSVEIAHRLHPARARIVDPGLDRNVRLHRRLAGRVAHAAAVQDLELVSYLIGNYQRIYVLPFAIDLAALDRAAAEAATPATTGPLRVFHAPSNRRVKGSDLIEDAVRVAASQADIELVTLTNVPHSAVLDRLARVDVVVDQLNAETPGVLAAEAMALDKPVLCEYDERKLASFARPTPVVAVDADTLAERLVELARDAGLRERLGAEGRDYARGIHAPAAAARAAAAMYRHVRTASPGIYEVGPEGRVSAVVGAEALTPALERAVGT